MRQRPPKLLLGSAGALGAVVFFVTLGALHVLQPELNGLQDFVSQFVNGPYGTAFSVATVTHGLANMALALGLALDCRGSRAGRWGSLLLGVAAMGIGLGGIFPTDPPGVRTTTAGLIHLAVATLSFPVELVALLLLTRAFAAEPAWRDYIEPTRLIALLGGISLAALVITILLRSVAGLAERAALLTFLVWELLASLRLMQTQRSMRPSIECYPTGPCRSGSLVGPDKRRK